MELEHDDLLVDHIEFDELVHYRIDLRLLSTRPKRALKRAILDAGIWEAANRSVDEIKSVNFLDFRDISKLRISDVRDLTNVGETTLELLLVEIQSALIEMNSDSESKEELTELDSLEELRARITNSKTIEDLIESMIDYQKSIRNVSDREEFVWRNRLPWITDEPRTLGSIGAEIGVTRERIRQIQRKSSRYSYQIESNVQVLAEIQNILLGCSAYEEFREAMLEEELTTTASMTLGRIRHLAVELNQLDVVSDVEKAIYAWSSGFTSDID